MEEFLEVLKLEAQDIKMKFLRSSLEGKGTSQEVSDFREHAVQDLIQRYYPFPYRISKGGIYDSYGHRSDSIDCLILDPTHPHTVNSMGKHSLILADGVEAAIEVKPDIANKKELERGLIQGISVKKLRQRYGPIILQDTVSPHIVECSKQVPFFIFTMQAKKNIEDTINEIKSFYLQNSVPLANQLDIITILDKGIIVNYKYKEMYPWASANLSDEQKAGWIFEEWEENTLAGFLFHLDRLYGASPAPQYSYMKHYMAPLDIPFTSYN
ncbi:DUF6602 domain-containing protein [Pseudobacillus badius]|uniref:DUF6602 domain-containing protein n=1 Tax=Bacillus badius TaxID=1455 RepID=UPI0007B3478A|nr:DUF6602 domain-containing protein [Bacillus badius]KZR58353.1 hypothetical protein A3781_17290 [Bacillus badius]